MWVYFEQNRWSAWRCSHISNAVHSTPTPEYRVANVGQSKFLCSSRFSHRAASSTATSFLSTVSSVKSTIKRNQKSWKHGKSKSTTRHIAWCWRRIRWTFTSTVCCARSDRSLSTAAPTLISSTTAMCLSSALAAETKMSQFATNCRLMEPFKKLFN